MYTQVYNSVHVGILLCTHVYTTSLSVCPLKASRLHLSRGECLRYPMDIEDAEETPSW